jgi:23S rRNA (adenine2503-C2)-methyltransferase
VNAPAEDPDLFGLERPLLERWMSSHGARAFHGRQVFRWMYACREMDPERWTDLPAALRAELIAHARLSIGRIAHRTESRDGTVKYLIEPSGGGAVESVLMVRRDRVTLCLSSQVGCALGCDFCLTARMGWIRDLTPGEILGQVVLIQNDRTLGERRFNVVFMGMGEPLHNYDAVMSAVRTLTDPAGFGLSRRRITVSTAGLAPAIERLAAEPLRPRLAVSLNATTDEVRDRIMPINRKYPLGTLLEACRRFRERTGDSLSFEYVLLDGVNDADQDVERLLRILRQHPAKLNLIPFNPVPGALPFRPTPEHRVTEILKRMIAAGARASVRWSQGMEARAACGQLAVLPGERGAAAVSDVDPRRNADSPARRAASPRTARGRGAAS